MASVKDATCLDLGEENRPEHKPQTRRHFMTLALMVAVGFMGGLLVAGKTGSNGPVNVAVHLNGATLGHQVAVSEVPVMERKLNVAPVVLDDPQRELKGKKHTSNPTSMATFPPSPEPTMQATFPHGTSSPVEDRKLVKTVAEFGNDAAERHRKHRRELKNAEAEKAMGEDIEDRELKGKKSKTPTSVPTVLVPTGTKKPTEKRRELKGKKSKTPTSVPTVVVPTGTKKPTEKRRELKKTSTEEVFSKFSPGHETHNPTPSQFHPTKKPSHDDRRELKKNKSKPTANPTSEPTVQATFPHGTASPVEKRRSLKKTSTDEVFGKFSPGHETHNPTPSQFHPTKKPSHDDRRELKKNKSKPTANPTSEPTVQATFPHGTASPVEKRRSMKTEQLPAVSALSESAIAKAATA